MNICRNLLSNDFGNFIIVVNILFLTIDNRLLNIIISMLFFLVDASVIFVLSCLRYIFFCVLECVMAEWRPELNEQFRPLVLGLSTSVPQRLQHRVDKY